jgi:colanic acid/amylovoran biosynthesis protein
MNLHSLYTGPNAPIIGLYGIGGVYNYGCEAIVRGTEIILRKTWPDVRIIYASLRPEDDKRRLKGSNVEIIPRKVYPKWTIQWFGNALRTITGIPCPLYREDLSWVDECDIILSIGGDIYTLPPKYKDRPLFPYYQPLIHFGNIVKKRGKKLVIWGASIGPFDGSPKAKKAFVEHLQTVDLITSREPRTTSYLKSIGIADNVIEYIDPAFMVPSSAEQTISTPSNNKIKIGINLSPLSTLYSFGDKERSEAISKQADVIISLINNMDAEVLLIPHVVCDFNINDDDLRYLTAIRNTIPNNLLDRVHLIDSDPGFIGTKQILAECDIVIAARMHCAINAVAAGVPTIFVAYSQKAVGMAEYVYGNKEWVIPLKELSEDKLLSLVKTQLLLKDRTFLVKLNNELQKSVLIMTV